MLVALSSGEAILVICLVAVPIGAITFALGAGRALDQVGKGQFSVEFEQDLPQKMVDSGADLSAAGRKSEIRQLLEAKAYRQRARGETPLDVDAEMERLLKAGSAASDAEPDAALHAEVRQLVIARNERRARQGKEPLDVEAEVERQLRELESLGQ